MFDVKFGDFAVYHGKEYPAGRQIDKKIVLFSKDHMDVQKGFVFDEDEFIKVVESKDLDSAYMIHTIALYRRNECLLLGVHEGNYRLQFYNNYKIAEQCGFTMIESGVYEKHVQFEEIEEIWIEKKPIWGFDLPESEKRRRIF